MSLVFLPRVSEPVSAGGEGAQPALSQACFSALSGKSRAGLARGVRGGPHLAVAPPEKPQVFIMTAPSHVRVSPWRRAAHSPGGSCPGSRGSLPPWGRLRVQQ